MAITFNGRDLVAHFKEDPNSVAIKQYRVEYACLTGTVVHYIDALNTQGEDEDGNSLYRDVLTYAENEAAGLTRSPTVTLFAQDANLKWSAGLEIPAINPIPVFDNAPSIVPTTDGVIVAVTEPSDRDLEGYAAWVGTEPDFPLDASTLRYRGKATQFPIPLPDRSRYYVRVAPFDAFGVDTFAAWPAQEAKRNLLPGYNDYPLIKRIDEVALSGLRAVTAADSMYQTYMNATTAYVTSYVDALRADVLADGTNWQSAIQQLTAGQANLQTAITNEQTTRIGQFAAQAITNTALGARIDANEAAITLERNTRATEKDAFVSQQAQFQARIATAEANIIAEHTAWTNGLSAQATTFNQQLSQLDTSVRAFVVSKTDTLTTTTNALTTQYNQLAATLGTAQATITSNNTASINRDNANTSAINTVQSNLNGTNQTLASVQQTMTTQSTRLGNIEAQATLVVQAGNVITGWKLIANSSGVSQIVMDAGAFVFRNNANGINYPIVELVGGVLRIPTAMIGEANIYEANIVNLAVGTNKLAINSVTDTYYIERTTPVTGTNVHVNVLSYTFNAEVECEVLVDMSATQGFPSGDRLWEFGMYCDGNQMRPIFGGQKTNDTPNAKARVRVGPGSHTVYITWRGESSAVRLAYANMIIHKVKR